MNDRLPEECLQSIAVIGMAGRFPGAGDVDSFWENLAQGVETIVSLKVDELRRAGVPDALLAKPSYVRAAAPIENPDLFDADFFGFTPREAEITDPQHRLLLECAHRALEDAGYVPERFDGKIGVFASVGMNTYLLNNLYTRPDLLDTMGRHRLMIGNDKGFVSTLISFKLNLTGPSMVVDTACSSSLAAVHQACKSLLAFESDMMLAGGMFITSPPRMGYLYEEGGIASPDGHCRVFDDQARGTVMGNGGGLVLLKRLDQALEDRDHIYGVIRGSAINNDGSAKSGYTAPSVAGQEEVIAEALAFAQIDPETISYVETHGTGTLLGDPIEIGALSEVYRRYTRRREFCAVGSVKSNIGHLDAAAGVAGLIKTMLAFKHRFLPPSLHCRKPNPRIGFPATPFFVNAEGRPWDAPNPLRAAVSSFGIGGTNVHAVLEESPRKEPSKTHRGAQLFVLSAKTKPCLERASQSLGEYLARHSDLDAVDVAHTLQVGRKAYAERCFAVAPTLAEAANAFAGKSGKPAFGSVVARASPEVCFLFPGQGSQYVRMTAGLYQEEPVFRGHLDRCADFLVPILGLDPREVLYPENGEDEAGRELLNETRLTQPLLFAVEYALFELWRSWGVRPAAMLGHSIGEYVAACVAGVFSLEDALSLTCARGALMQQMPAGLMLSASLTEQECLPLLKTGCELAAINGPRQLVLSGPTRAIEAAERQLKAMSVSCRRLHTSHAFHSSVMEPVLDEFQSHFQGIEPRAPEIPFISNVTGTWIEEADAIDPKYWAKQLRSTVRFGPGLRTMLNGGHRILLEVGPGQALTSLAASAGGEAIPSLAHPRVPQPDGLVLHTALGRLWSLGVEIDWQGYGLHETRARTPLPGYPFRRESYWIEPKPGASTLAGIHAGGQEHPETGLDYRPFWRESQLGGDVPTDRESWLIFKDPLGFGDTLADYLHEREIEVIAVQPGENFKRHDRHRFTLNPASVNDYLSLIESCSQGRAMPARLVHAWGIYPVPPDTRENGLDSARDLAFFSVVYLLQALGGHMITDPLSLAVVTNQMQRLPGDSDSQPEKALVLGPCKIAGQEYANLRCASIDLDASETTAQDPDAFRGIANRLFGEMAAGLPDEVVAYRRDTRFAQSYEAVPDEGDDSEADVFREQGVYCITGGLGGIGFELGKHLARDYRARLVLIGRSRFPERKAWDQWLSGEIDPRGEQYLREKTRLESRVPFDLADEAEELLQGEARLERELEIVGLHKIEGLAEDLNRSCAALIFDYFLESGVGALGTSLERTELKRRLGILPAYDRFLDFFLATLEEERIIEVDGNRIGFIKGRDALEETEALADDLVRRYPDLTKMVRFLKHCVAHYSDALSGRTQAIGVLFPGGKGDVLEEAFSSVAGYSSFEIYARLLGETLSVLARRSPAKPLRILEVGAGRGILTGMLAPYLRDSAVEYHFTDLGPSFVQLARANASAFGLDNMVFKTLDITGSLVEQGYAAESFDVVIGYDVVHATPDIAVTLANLKGLLGPNGLLFLVESVMRTRWAEMIWGLTDGWWLFEDREVRPHSPIADAETWERVLSGLGFHNLKVLPNDRERRGYSDHALIAAQQLPTLEGPGFHQRVLEVVKAKQAALSEKIQRVRTLEEFGAEVLVLNADVADREDMERAKATAQKQFGRIQGVVHAAGVYEGGMIQLLNRPLAEAQFQAKVRGALVLDRVFPEVDFLLCCSSLVALLGGVGQVSYAASNAFLDAFAENRQGRGNRSVQAVNWGRWQGIGLAVEVETKHRELTGEPLEGGITVDRGLNAIARILQRKRARTVVCPLDFPELLAKRLESESVEGPSTSGDAGGRKPATVLAEKQEVASAIHELWKGLLGIEQVGFDDNFYEIGGDSLLLLQLHRQVKDRFDIDIPVVVMFKHPTVNALAEYLAAGGETPAPVEQPRRGVGKGEKIAIIGMAAHFPGANNPASFWENLVEGRCAVRILDEATLAAHGVEERLFRRGDYVRACSLAEHIEDFDAELFGFTPREAEITDPQQRHLLLCAWEALEDAGYAPDRECGRIGVFAGTAMSCYMLYHLLDRSPASVSPAEATRFQIANDKDFASTLISYKLNLTGPSVNINTACSTSLVALHHACRSLLAGDCDMALVGGSRIGLPHHQGYLYQEGGIQSPDGYCRAFDTGAKGTIMGSGAGMVVLKRLEDALADGDHVDAVILGSAVNNDGAGKVGFTAPGVTGQSSVIKDALAAAGVAPESIGLVEAHGTGTPLGDPIEITALCDAFGDTGTRKGFCAVGSVKTNIGHLDAAAGVAGLIKTVLALKHRKIPPSLHFNKPNPDIDFAPSPFYVVRETRDWERGEFPLRAGISSFGFGGTNAHVVVEEGPDPATPSPSRQHQLLLFSAKTETALSAGMARLADHLSRTIPGPSLADVAHTLRVGRAHLPHRAVVVGSEIEEVAAALNAADPARLTRGCVVPGGRSIAMLFPGQAAQYPGMAHELYTEEPAYREAFDLCADIVLAQSGEDLRALLGAPTEQARARLAQTEITQPAMFSVCYALTRLWHSWGIRPTVLLGHSIGEYVAACVAEVFSLENALELVIARARLIQTLPVGAMLAVPWAEAELLPYLDDDSLDLAAVNAPDRCVVSGPADAIDGLQEKLAGQGIRSARLETSHAFHCAMMAPILDEFARLVRQTPRKAPRIPFISNVTGTWIGDREAEDPAYWTAHLRKTVRFSQGVDVLLDRRDLIFLEVGPGNSLASMVRRHDQARGRVVLTTTRHARERRPDQAFILETLGKLWIHGISPDWQGFRGEEKRQRLALPTYVFDLKRHWVEPALAEPLSNDTGRETRKVRIAERKQTVPALRTDTDAAETELVAIWRELFGIDDIGRYDNFFEMGGDSVLLAEAHHKIKQRFETDLTVVDMFKYPTIAALAGVLCGATHVENPFRRAQLRLSRQRPVRARDVAVIGMSFRLPGSACPDSLWENLMAGVESIADLSDEDLRAAGVDPALIQNSQYVKRASIIENIDRFDANFFDFTPREAEITDPQLRLLLTCAHEAFERAGRVPGEGDAEVGVFVGTAMSNYLINNILTRPDITQAFGQVPLAIGNDKDFVATQISYKLNLKGPSVNVNTACSTSLVAIAQAYKSLTSGECDMALAGGASISVPSARGYVFEEGGIQSPDGRCRPFDADAKGTVLGSGVGIVLLKRLEDALSEGDPILAVIKGAAVNNDGSEKPGYTAPGIAGQADVIARAIAMAGTPVESIGYIEAHGTATVLGDPIEVQALTEVFRGATQKTGFCALGSLKSNMGHLDSAAGVAGFIKTLLVLERGQIPPTLHFQKPNPKIDFEAGPFFVTAETRAWQPEGLPRRAGVSSFGIGGTNAHVVLEQAPVREVAPTYRDWHLIPFSARTEESLARLSLDLANHLRRHPHLALADMAFTLQNGRRPHPYRRVLLCSDREEAVQALEAGSSAGFRAEGRASERKHAFLFTGRGSGFLERILAVYRHDLAFFDALERCAARFEPHVGFDLMSRLKLAEERDAYTSSLPDRLPVQQALLFSVHYALASMWRSWGPEPGYLMGIGVGELAAAWFAGVFDLEEMPRLIVKRAELLERLPVGDLLAVSLPEFELEPQLGDCDLAAVFDSSHCLASGTVEAVTALERRLSAEGIACRRQNARYPFHSKLARAIVPDLRDLFSGVSLSSPRVPIIAADSGQWLEPERATDPGYWANQVSQTIRFSRGLETLAEEPGRFLFDVATGSPIEEAGGANPWDWDASAGSAPWPASPSRPSSLDQTLARMWCSGNAIVWSGQYPAEVRSRVVLPTYPFEGQRYWVEPGTSGLSAPKKTHLEKKKNMDDWFYESSWKRMGLPASPEKSGDGEMPVWWVFRDDDGLADPLIAELRDSDRKVVAISPGRAFSRIGEDRFSIDPAQEDHYRQLCEALSETGSGPDAIVHLWSMARIVEEAPLPDPAQAILERGFHSLIHLAKALGKHFPERPLRLAVISNGAHLILGEEPVQPINAVLLGPTLVIPQEYRNIRTKLIDLVPRFDPVSLPLPASRIIAEIRTDTDRVIAYRGAYRWVRCFEPVRLPKTEKTGPVLKERGVYLITGGLGGLGYAFANHLAENYRARLVLVGRAELPPESEWRHWHQRGGESDSLTERMEKLLALRALGAEVMAASADVTDPASMGRALETARARFGRIDGIIHAAGIAGGGVIQLKQRAAVERVLAPKVFGTLVLAQLLREHKPDFLLLCSSIASVMGELGQVDYCAANAFLDAFAWAASKNEDGIPVIAVNWDTWQEVGMAVDTPVSANLKAMRAMSLARGISNAEGCSVLERTLGLGRPQYLVSTVDLDARLDQTWDLDVFDEPETRKKRAPAQKRPDLDTGFEPPSDTLEALLAGIWADVLGFEAVGIHDHFFELGGDSLIGIRIMAQIQKHFEEHLHTLSLFESPTVSRLAGFLRENYAAGVAKLSGRKFEEKEIGTVVGADLVAKFSALIPRRSLPKANAKNPGMVFVLSPPRSGSTLLRVMLAGNPNLFAPPELALLSSETLAERRQLFAEQDASILEGTIQAVMQLEGCGLEEACSILDRLEREGYTTLQLYGWMQRRLGSRLLVDKTPPYAMDPNTLQTAETGFQNPRYIHLLRHPYGMIRSFMIDKTDVYMRHQFKLDLDTELTSRQVGELFWLISHRNILSLLETVPEERRFTLRFEDLVTRPEPIMREMCTFLSIPFDGGMLLPYSEKKQRMTRSILPDTRMVGDRNFHQFSHIEPGVAEKWRNTMTQDFLGEESARLARTFGYALIQDEEKPDIIDKADKDLMEEKLNRLDDLSPEEVDDLLAQVMADQGEPS